MVSVVGWMPGQYSQPTVLAVAPARPDSQTIQMGIAVDAAGYPNVRALFVSPNPPLFLIMKIFSGAYA
jgi:hypothetical protein